MENIASPLDLLTSLKIAFVERDEAADAFDVFRDFEAKLGRLDHAGAGDDEQGGAGEV